MVTIKLDEEQADTVATILRDEFARIERELKEAPPGAAGNLIRIITRARDNLRVIVNTVDAAIDCEPTQDFAPALAVTP